MCSRLCGRCTVTMLPLERTGSCPPNSGLGDAILGQMVPRGLQVNRRLWVPAYQFVREPLRAEEVDKLSHACESMEEKLTVWTLFQDIAMGLSPAHGGLAVECDGAEVRQLPRNCAVLCATTSCTFMRGTPPSYTAASTWESQLPTDGPAHLAKGLLQRCRLRSSSYGSSTTPPTLRPSTSTARSRHRRHPARASKRCPPIDSSGLVPSSVERRRHTRRLFDV